jgi:hypothetical protein
MTIYENDGTFISGVLPSTPTRLRIWQGEGDKRDGDESLPCPAGGAVLRIRGDRSYDEWFASIDEANAELERIALSEGLELVRPPASSVCCGYRFAWGQPFDGWVAPRDLWPRYLNFA